MRAGLALPGLIGLTFPLALVIGKGATRWANWDFPLLPDNRLHLKLLD